MDFYQSDTAWRIIMWKIKQVYKVVFEPKKPANLFKLKIRLWFISLKATLSKLFASKLELNSVMTIKSAMTS